MDQTPLAKIENSLNKLKKQEDKTPSINILEFQSIAFEQGLPRLIKDLASYLTGDPDSLKTSHIISEGPELTGYQHGSNEGLCSEGDLEAYTKNMKEKEIHFILNTFRTLEGKEAKASTSEEAQKIYQEATYEKKDLYLEESHFTKNFARVFGVDCPFFGKLLYLYMSRGKDHAKISLLRFLECLYPLLNSDNRQNHNKIAFQILDIDNDNSLNILNLLHLKMNLDPDCKRASQINKLSECKLGHEIFKLIDYYIQNYLTKKSLTSSPPMGINYDIFSKIVVKSCMVEYLRETLFGIDPTQDADPKPKAPNIFRQPSITEGDCENGHSNMGYIFKELDKDIMNDMSMGQRGYSRNLDFLLAYLVHYNKRAH